jgi:hypothetical protein
MEDGHEWVTSNTFDVRLLLSGVENYEALSIGGRSSMLLLVCQSVSLSEDNGCALDVREGCVAEPSVGT